MKITRSREDRKLTLYLEGMLDSGTSSMLDDVVSTELADVQELCLDLEKLEYVSSAGLRVILKAQEIMEAQGTMRVLHTNEIIMDVFDLTGFADFLVFE